MKRPQRKKQPTGLVDDLAKSIRHFEKHMVAYRKALSEQEKQLAKQQMEKELLFMDFTGKQLNKEQRSLESRLSKDFQIFLNFPTENNSSVVAQDLEALGESLKP